MPVGQRFIESLPHPDHHLEAWRYVAGKVQTYPDGLNVQPYRRPRTPEIAKGLHTIQLSRVGQLTANGGGVVLTSCDGQRTDTAILPLGSAALDQLKAQLFSERKRGKLQVFAQGVSAEFRQLLDLYGRQLLAAGYQIHVLGTLARIVALRVTKSNRTWWLCDAETVTGVPLKALERQICEIEAIAGEPESHCAKLHRVLRTMQRELVTRFGVSFHPTIGQSAAKAAASYIPDGVWLWRPSPTFIAMSRAGGAFRGGYVESVNYDGPAWKIDIRRQYTAALSADFPRKISFGVWHETGRSSRGLYMCTVYGPGKMRVLLNVWKLRERRFSLEKWNGKECVCILSTHEIEGLHRLGYLVLPGYGFVYNHCFNFRPFVKRLQQLTDIHGSDSVIGQMCKSLGSKVWGKWAQPPQRTEIAYSEERPDKEWAPFQRDTGEEIERLWTREHTVYTSLQHIELAVVVTCVGRSMLYSKAAQLLNRGYELAQLMTDSIIVKGKPPPRPPPEEVPIGSWRYVGWSEMVHTRRTGASVWLEEVRRPGVSGATAAEVIAIGAKEAPPEGEAPIPVSTMRLVR